MTWLILRFYDTPCVCVDSIFYRTLLLLIYVCLRDIANIWLHRCKNMYTILYFLYNLVCLKLWEGLYCFALITCFTMLPLLSQVTCFLDVWDILYYFTIFSTFLLYCVWLYYIFILLQIYYIANVSSNWVLFSVLHFYSIIFVSYILNIPYYSKLVMFFTILHFYWIEFVADLFWKHPIVLS